VTGVNGQRPDHQRGEGHPLDELAIYALDAVSDDDRRAIDDHLAGCTFCQHELAEHRAALAHLVVDEAPPPTVWDAVVAQIRQPADADGTVTMESATRLDGLRPVVAPAGAAQHEAAPQRPRPGPPPAHFDRSLARRRAQRRRLVGLVAAAAVALAVVGIAPRLWDDDGGTDAQISDAVRDGRTVGVLAGEDGADMARVVTYDRSEFVVLDGLPELGSDRSYQLWDVDGPEPVSVGLLGDGTVEAVPVDLPDSASRLAITDELAGGARAPTGPILASGTVTRPT
jgi:anti-sigma-K factor RskA